MPVCAVPEVALPHGLLLDPRDVHLLLAMHDHRAHAASVGLQNTLVRRDQSVTSVGDVGRGCLALCVRVATTTSVTRMPCATRSQSQSFGVGRPSV